MRIPAVVCLVIGAVSLGGTSFADDLGTADAPRRVAFAISGGASKGAYEAGLN
jgi:hypothetical protein